MAVESAIAQRDCAAHTDHDPQEQGQHTAKTMFIVTARASN